MLGAIAVGQIAAVAWFIASLEPVAEPVARNMPPAVADPVSPAIEEHAHSAPEAAAPTQTQAAANVPPIEPAPAIPPAAEQALADGVNQQVALQNKAALFFLDKGMALRNEGDMQGALVHFTSAASLEENHPRILYEFAVTYEKMGLESKAIQFWKSIYGMGRTRGGDYFSLADFRLKGQAPSAPGAPGAPIPDGLPTDPDPEAAGVASAPERGFLEIASVIQEPDDTVAEGFKVVVHVLIRAVSEAPVNPKYVHVRVDFYDLVNESLVDLTRAVPANRWVTQPVDWKDQAEELLEVAYFLPPQSDQDILDFGHRAYHGYVVKVFYRDELQDIAAEPGTLLEDIGEGAGSSTPPGLSTVTSFPAPPAPVTDEAFVPR